MKEYEGFVKMTKAEFIEKQPAITTFPGKGWYKAGIRRAICAFMKATIILQLKIQTVHRQHREIGN